MDGLLAKKQKGTRQIQWSHATNSTGELEHALQSGVDMIEADVMLSLESDAIIMCHPPHTTSDLTLAQFLTRVAAANSQGLLVGIKLDFKDPAAVPLALAVLQAMPALQEGTRPLALPH